MISPLTFWQFTQALVSLFGKAKEIAESEVVRPLTSFSLDAEELAEVAMELLGRGKTIVAAGLIRVNGYEFRQVVLAYQLGWAPPGRFEFLTFRENIEGRWREEGIPLFGDQRRLDGMKILVLTVVSPDCMDNSLAQQQVVHAAIAKLMGLDKLPKAGP